MHRIGEYLSQHQSRSSLHPLHPPLHKASWNPFPAVRAEREAATNSCPHSVRALTRAEKDAFSLPHINVSILNATPEAPVPSCQHRQGGGEAAGTYLEGVCPQPLLPDSPGTAQLQSLPSLSLLDFQSPAAGFPCALFNSLQHGNKWQN